MAPRQLFAISSLSLFFGCGLVGNFQSIYFYPINTASPPQSFRGTIYNLSGTIKLTLSDGEEYKGELSAVSRPEDPRDSLYSNELGFPKHWETVYGENYYSKNVLGTERYWRGKLVASSGAFVYVEVTRPNLKSDTRLGVAIDSAHQTYKITF